MNKNLIIAIDIPNVAKNNMEEYFNGFTFSLLKYKIITKDELRIMRKHRENLKNPVDEDSKFYRDYLTEMDKNKLKNGTNKI